MTVTRWFPPRHPAVADLAVPDQAAVVIVRGLLPPAVDAALRVGGGTAFGKARAAYPGRPFPPAFAGTLLGLPVCFHHRPWGIYPLGRYPEDPR